MKIVGYKVTTSGPKARAIGSKAAESREVLGDAFGVVYDSKVEAEKAVDSRYESAKTTWFADLSFHVCRIERA